MRFKISPDLCQCFFVSPGCTSKILETLKHRSLFIHHILQESRNTITNIYVCIYIYIYLCHFEIDEEFGLDVNGGPGPYCLCVVFSLSGVGLVIYSVAAVLR